MSATMAQQTTILGQQSAKRSIKRVLPWIGMGLCLTVLIGHLAYDRLGGASLHAAAADRPHEAKAAANSAGATPGGATTVTLSEAKFKEARIGIEPARVDRISTEVGVV